MSISKNNRNLDEDELNFVVQSTIDRIIFLRIAEDRGIETYAELKNALTGEDYYRNLLTSFKQADDKYNSGLFDFRKDRISSGITVENKIIKKIINELYYPESPYEFAVLPVEILGSAYEQFLGKVIRIDKSHKAKIEEKPEVRKAGGVYYTPQYIVDYIVKNTVGKLVEGKTPNEVSKLKIVDPACGSGSFLLGAYQFLLDWHKEIFSKETIHSSRRGTKGDVLTAEGSLTTSEKKRILLNNIFGVDIDANAVEVTKLSLLLKCLEGETSASIEHQLSMFNERVLPTLDDNIKVGNSLIDTDFYSNQLDFGEEKKIKPFNWQKAFPGVFAQGGFDAVIGNPPYYLVDDKIQKEYLKTRFKTLHFKINLFACFSELPYSLLKEDGMVSYIVPNLLFANDSMSKLRNHFLIEYAIGQLVNLGDGIFMGVSMPTMIFVMMKTKVNFDHFMRLIPKSAEDIDSSLSYLVLQSSFLNNFNFVFETSSPAQSILIKRIESKSITIEDVLDVNQGIITGNDKEYLSNFKHSDNWKQTIRGKDVGRYITVYPELYVNYTRDELACPRTIDLFESHEKLLMRRTGDFPIVSYDNKQTYNLHTLYSCRLKTSYPIKLLLALLNSRLLKFIYQRRLGTESGRVFAEIKILYVRKLPIPEFTNESFFQTKICEVINLVEQLISLYKERQSANLETHINQFQNKIDYSEDRINQIVYELYGLTEEEIRIVEGNLE